MIQYIICDMDGTLLDEQKQFSPYLFPLIDILHEKQIQFAVASGRQYFNLKERFSAYAKDMLFICENGSIMMEGEQLIYADEIPYEKYLHPLQHMRSAHEAFPVLCGVKGAYIEHTDPEFVENCHMYYEQLTIVDDILEAAQQDTICKLAIYDKIKTDINAFPYMEGHQGSQHMVLSGDHWIDITNPGVNKGKAIQELKKRKQVQAEELMAFGDFMNDYEMLQECKYAYAMGNAHPSIKEICPYEAATNEQDGVVRAVCEALSIPYPPHK